MWVARYPAKVTYFSDRTDVMAPFLAMEVFERAVALEAEGRSILHFEVGEPDFAAPSGAITATCEALGSNRTRYTDSRGLLELREAIAEEKEFRTGIQVDPDQVIVTPGTSPAMLLVFSLLVSPGDEVLIPAPYYPCYPNFVRFFGGVPVYVPCDPEKGFRIEASRVKSLMTGRTKALILSSPANPTGAVQEPSVYEELSNLGLPIVSDEIYDGLLYDEAPSCTALGLDSPSFVLDGFSKRYAMTGFRLGYVIAPQEAVRKLHVLAQNTLISVSDFVQRAGIAALREGLSTLGEMKDAYDARRIRMVDGLRRIGFSIPVLPRGAFYILAGAKKFGESSRNLAFSLLDRTGVAVTPGVDFGDEAEGFLRFCYAVSDETIDEGLIRLQKVLG